jgi:hypothetical protein
MIVFYSKIKYQFTELPQEATSLALHLTFGKCFINDIPLKNPVT